MLDLQDAVLLTIHAAGTERIGRTVVQKEIFFERESGLVQVDFQPYYYGPYSAQVSEALQSLVGYGYIKEIVQTSDDVNYEVPSGWKRYQYELSEDGEKAVKRILEKNPSDYEKISHLIDVSKEVAHIESDTLSCAAKILYIIKKMERKLRIDEINEIADSFDWKLAPTQIETAIDLLKKLDFIEVTDNA